MNELRHASPRLDRTVLLRGLEASVEIFRDDLGVPHVRARSVHDAFFAQGFVHAQDRLWQMVYDRHRAAGRLASWLGPRALTLDVFVRRLGLDASARDDYDAYDQTTQDALAAYTSGVNAFIESTETLPIELTLLGVDPEPWQPWHCAAVMKVRHVLMGHYDRKLWRAQLLGTLGRDFVLSVGSPDGREDTLVIPPGERRVWSADIGELEPGALATAALAHGSNNWAVHGSCTASGLPLLAGDPHRTLEIPNVYYQNHLACPGFDAIGLSIPGVPGFFHFGHNAHVAWCITHAMADIQDLYVERFSDDGRYEFRGRWLEPERRTEEFAVRDGPAVKHDVTVTHHGPVVFGDPSSGAAITMRWTATDGPNTTLQSVLPMLTASSVDELEDAMRWWVDPCNNLLMADTHGTIAYLHRGRVPLRSRANGWAPVPGWTGFHEWEDDIPFEELPRVRNPETGYLVTANNRVCAEDYPAYLSMDYGPSYRARRILERLGSLEQATAENMAAIHADRQSIPAQTFLESIATLEVTNGRISQAREILGGWDGRMEPDTVAPTIYAALREKAVEILCERDPLRGVVPNPFPEEPLPTPAHTRVRLALARLLEQDDRTVLAGREWNDVIAEALDRAVGWLEEKLGVDPSMWRWSRIHTTRVRHPLARLYPEAAAVLNPPTIGCGGDAETVQVTGWELGMGVQYGSVARYVFDVGDWDRSAWIVPFGASGHPGSPHYADQAEAWADVRLHPMTYTWPKIEAGAETRQVLEPST